MLNLRKVTCPDCDNRYYDDEHSTHFCEVYEKFVDAYIADLEES